MIPSIEEAQRNPAHSASIECQTTLKDRFRLSSGKTITTDMNCFLATPTGVGIFTKKDKVIAAVDKNLAKHKSFIMLGPIKYLKKRNKLNVIEYGQDELDFTKRLSRDIREKNKLSSNKNSMIELTTIVGMHYFIQLLLYFFKTLNSQELVEIIGYISDKEKVVYDDFKILFNAALKLLFQDKKIVKITGEQYSSYKLTNIGFETMKLMITECTRAGLCDRIRVELMHNEFYKSPHS